LTSRVSIFFFSSGLYVIYILDGETGKGRTNNEAKGEPRIRLDDRSGVVTAVVAAADQAFVALTWYGMVLVSAGDAEDVMLYVCTMFGIRGCEFEVDVDDKTRLCLGEKDVAGR
jgi:hypothetical protein